MFLAFLILIILIAAIPAFAFADIAVFVRAIVLLSAIGLVMAAGAARTSEVVQTSRIMRPMLLVASLPALWMVFQVIPMPIALSASIWQSASVALSEKLLGHISINPSETIERLFLYISSLAFMAMIILVCQERRRAEQTLSALCIVSTLTSLMLSVIAFSGGNISSETLTAMSALGIVLNLTAIVRAFERYETRRVGGPNLQRGTIFNIALCFGGAVLCAVVLVVFARSSVRNVAFVAAGLFVVVEVLRRFDQLPRLVLLPCLIAVATAAVIAAWTRDPTVPYVLQFADLRLSSIAATENLLAEARWVGSGAGTFSSLLAIYGAGTFQAPTTAAELMVEFGWPMALIMVGTAMWLILLLLRGSLLRGRDSFYPAAAAAGATIVLGLAFCNVSLSQSSVALLAEVLVGLGLAQRISSNG